MSRASRLSGSSLAPAAKLKVMVPTKVPPPPPPPPPKKNASTIWMPSASRTVHDHDSNGRL